MRRFLPATLAGAFLAALLAPAAAAQPPRPPYIEPYPLPGHGWIRDPASPVPTAKPGRLVDDGTWVVRGVDGRSAGRLVCVTLVADGEIYPYGCVSAPWRARPVGR